MSTKAKPWIYWESCGLKKLSFHEKYLHTSHHTAIVWAYAGFCLNTVESLFSQRRANHNETWKHAASKQHGVTTESCPFCLAAVTKQFLACILCGSFKSPEWGRKTLREVLFVVVDLRHCSAVTVSECLTYKTLKPGWVIYESRGFTGLMRWLQADCGHWGSNPKPFWLGVKHHNNHQTILLSVFSIWNKLFVLCGKPDIFLLQPQAWFPLRGVQVLTGFFWLLQGPVAFSKDGSSMVHMSPLGIDERWL